MNEAINTGGPAFPTESAHQSGRTTWHHEGMTLRDHFAGLALQGMLANAHHRYVKSDKHMFSHDAYVLADAMLLARKGGAA